MVKWLSTRVSRQHNGKNTVPLINGVGKSDIHMQKNEEMSAASQLHQAFK